MQKSVIRILISAVIFILLSTMHLCRQENLKNTDDLAYAASEFKSSYQENRIRSLIHYFFSLFEGENRNPQAIVELLVDDDLEMIYPWGVLKSPREVKEWLAQIPLKSKDAHHIKRIEIKILDETHYLVLLDVLWQNLDPEGKFDSAKLRYEFKLIDKGGKFPKIEKLHSKNMERSGN